MYSVAISLFGLDLFILIFGGNDIKDSNRTLIQIKICYIFGLSEY